MTTLWSRLGFRKPATEPLAITVYSRQGCGCCHKAIGLLEGFRGRYRLRIEEVDVDESPELKARYGMEVPVVAVDGRVRFRGVVNPAMLERLLRAEAPKAAGPER
ncbi:glutaredoxin family protein [Planctomyces sp. SH-PL62]|uniref:glutaredoxin family protein n=1 Tax=Planctomyces sp. SH-PL62 TaxID=1636152 RepID=UPI00078E21A3|nr:glutaredoxin family protein [Planctomyces sp. SH-PL62]AMV38772.1 Glutaredoxin [Planctomyces sp. SH-PL62]